MASGSKDGGHSFSGDLSRDLSFFLNVSLDENAITSTPRRVRKKPAAAKSPFKVPSYKAPKQNPIVGKCERCNREYRTLRNFKKHMQGHALKDIASRAPNIQSLRSDCASIGDSTLNQMLSQPSVGCHAAEFMVLLQSVKEKSEAQDDKWPEFLDVLADEFQTIVSGDSFGMPSTLIGKSLNVADNILTSLDKREVLVMKLLNTIECSNTKVINSFICEFVFVFADQVIIHICRSLRNACDTTQQPEVSFDDEERQCVFYIGGSIFHGFRQMAYKYEGSKKWKTIREVIQTNILEDKTEEELSERLQQDRSWTVKKNRGGLLMVKGVVQEFLLSLAQIVATHEQTDGSLSVDQILTQVMSGKPKYDWDAIIGTSLEESLSLSLLVGVAKSFISTYGKGVIKRRLNKLHQNKATVSVTLRHKVAPR